MRVLLVAPDHPPDMQTGRSAAFARLAEELARHHDTRLVAGYRTDRARIPGHALGVDLRGRSGFSEQVALWRAVREVVGRFDPDVAVCQGVAVPPIGRPTIAVVRDLVGSGWDAPVRRLRVRRYACLVVPTQAVRRHLGALGVDPWKTEVIPDGFAVPAEPPPPAPGGSALELLHPGAIHPAKGQHLSIDAVARLPLDAKRRVRLVVAGAARSPRYVSQLRIAARGQPVEVVADPPDLAPLVDRAHLVLYPTSLDEGFPDGAVLAMVRGRPVAYSDRPALREALGDGGIAVSPADVPALRGILLEVLAGTRDLGQAGRRAHAFARDRYGWDRLLPRWRTLLASTAIRRTAPPTRR